MKYNLILFFTLLTLAGQTQNHKVISQYNTYNFDLQGHRGARGLAPENTLQAFRKALDIGVNTLELDVVVSKDKQVVVSHEPWMNADICHLPQGKFIQKSKEKEFNIYQMTYEEVKTFDCGSKFNPDFPEQNLESSYKPLLKEVLNMAEGISKNHGKKINYNIELKSSSDGDDIFHPKPQSFVKLVMNILQSETKLRQVNLQSFDFRILRELHKVYPNLSLAALVYKSNLETALSDLGFIPDIYSPYYPLVNKQVVQKAHEKGIKVIPWTVNELDSMNRLLKMGVDGIITDYPDRAIKLKKDKTKM